MKPNCLIYWNCEEPYNQYWTYQSANSRGAISTVYKLNKLREHFNLQAYDDDVEAIFEEFGLYVEAI